LGDLRTLGTPLGVLLSVKVLPLAGLLHHRGYIAAAEYPCATLGLSLTTYSIVSIVPKEAEAVAQGTIPSVVVQRSPKGDRGEPRVGNLLPSRVIDKPRKGAPDSGYPGNISWMDYGESRPGPSGGVGASSRYYPRG
jgi:hypothetical protein